MRYSEIRKDRLKKTTLYNIDALLRIKHDFSAEYYKYTCAGEFHDKVEHLWRYLVAGTKPNYNAFITEHGHMWYPLFDHTVLFKRLNGTKFLLSCSYSNEEYAQKLFLEARGNAPIKMQVLPNEYNYYGNDTICLMFEATWKC